MNHSSQRLVMRRAIQSRHTTGLFPRRYYYSVIRSFQSSLSNFVDEQRQKYDNKQKKEDSRRSICRSFFSSTTNMNTNNEEGKSSSNNTTNNTTTNNNIRDRARCHYLHGKIKYEEGKASAKIKYEAGKVVVKQRYKEGKVQVPKLAKRGAVNSYQKLKQYGPVFIGTYFTLYMTALGGFYVGIGYDLIDPVSMMGYLTGSSGEMEEECRTTAQVMIEYLSHYSWSQPAVPFLEKHPQLANLAVAWVATKFTEPARFVVCFAAVPKLADYLGFVPTIKTEVEEEEEKKQ